MANEDALHGADLLMVWWIAAVSSVTLPWLAGCGGQLTALCTHKLVCVSSTSPFLEFCLYVCLSFCQLLCLGV